MICVTFFICSCITHVSSFRAIGHFKTKLQWLIHSHIPPFIFTYRDFLACVVPNTFTLIGLLEINP